MLDPEGRVFTTEIGLARMQRHAGCKVKFFGIRSFFRDLTQLCFKPVGPTAILDIGISTG